MFRNLFVKAFAIYPILFSTVCMSEPIKWSSEGYSLYAKNDSLQDVIADIAAGQGVPVEIDSSVEGTVSAMFADTSRREVFHQLVKAYGLSWYYDGHVLYIDRLANNKSQTITLKSLHPREFKRQLMELGVYEEDERLHWKAVDERRVIHVSGPATFVDKVSTMANKLDNSYSGGDTIYKWRDRKGQIHFSSDFSEVPAHAEIIKLPHKKHLPHLTIHEIAKTDK